MATYIHYGDFKTISSNNSKKADEGIETLNIVNYPSMSVPLLISYLKGKEYKVHEIFLMTNRPNRMIRNSTGLHAFSDTLVDITQKACDALHNSVSVYYTNPNYRYFIPFFAVTLNYNSIVFTDVRDECAITAEEKNLVVITENEIQYSNKFPKELFNRLIGETNGKKLMAIAKVNTEKKAKQIASYKNDTVTWAMQNNILFSHNSNVTKKELIVALEKYRTVVETMCKQFRLSTKDMQFPSLAVAKRNSNLVATYSPRTNIILMSTKEEINTYYHELAHFLETKIFAHNTNRELWNHMKNSRSKIAYLAYAKQNNTPSHYSYLHSMNEVFARFMESYCTFIFHYDLYKELLQDKSNTLNTVEEIREWESVASQYDILDKLFFATSRGAEIPKGAEIDKETIAVTKAVASKKPKTPIVLNKENPKVVF